MTWYAVNLLFESNHSMPTGKETLWEESIRLIRANDAQEAEKRAISIGKASEHSYAAEGADIVTWTFVQVGRVFEIEDQVPGDNSELFSRFLRASEVRSLLTPFEDG
jgi:hypothetical protein